jgi:WD40 repeat protein
VNCVRWAPATNDAAVAGQLLASAGDDGLVKIWRLLDN